MTKGRRTMKETVHIEEPKLARFLFTSPAAAPIWLVARIWLGYQWLHAGWEKISGTDGGWHLTMTSQSWLKSSAGLKGFAGYALANAKGPHAAVNYGWYAAFLRWITHSGGFLAPVIALGEFLIGAALILGLLTGIAAVSIGRDPNGIGGIFNGILGGVDRVLEPVVQVAPLDDLDRWQLIVEKPGNRGPRQAVGLVLEFVDGFEMALEVLEPVELPERRRELDGLAVEDRREPLRLGCRGRHPVDHEGLGDRLDAVDDIVEP
jgi:uncharacterized membrane protein YphA (DoxX/SURF4 family)